MADISNSSQTTLDQWLTDMIDGVLVKHWPSIFQT